MNEILIDASDIIMLVVTVLTYIGIIGFTGIWIMLLVGKYLNSRKD